MLYGSVIEGNMLVFSVWKTAIALALGGAHNKTVVRCVLVVRYLLEAGLVALAAVPKRASGGRAGDRGSWRGFVPWK